MEEMKEQKKNGRREKIGEKWEKRKNRRKRTKHEGIKRIKTHRTLDPSTEMIRYRFLGESQKKLTFTAAWEAGIQERLVCGSMWKT